MNVPRKDDRDGEGIDRRSGRDRRVIDDIHSFCSDKRECVDRRSGKARRRCDRFKVSNFTFVKLLSDSDEDLGQLLDISHKGLAFRYLSDAEQPTVFTELSIVLPGNVPVISGISFKTVSDISLNSGKITSPIIFRRAGVQFKPMTSEQAFELDHFIESHVLGQRLSPE